MHTVEVYDGCTNQQTGEKYRERVWQNSWPSLEAASKYASRIHLPFRSITITDTKLSVVYDSLTSDGNHPADPPAPDTRRTMPRRPQPVSTTPTITFAVYGTGESSTENTVALLDDLIEGLQPCTPKFVIPLGKVLYTDAVSDVRTYALDKGYEYVAVHSEPVGRAKALKEASEGAATLTKTEDVAQEILDVVGKARDARLLFFWNDEDGVDVEDEQRLLNAVLAADVVALDVAQGMEPIAPDEEGAQEAAAAPETPEEPTAEETTAAAAADEPQEGEEPDPEYEDAKGWPFRRLKTFAISIGYDEADVPDNAKAILAMLYPDETAGEPAPTPEDSAPRPAKEIREEIEKEAAAKPAAKKTPPKAAAADEAQTEIPGTEVAAEAGVVIANAIADALADLIFDKVIERLHAHAKEAPKDDIVRTLVPPRRPGRPAKED